MNYCFYGFLVSMNFHYLIISSSHPGSLQRRISEKKNGKILRKASVSDFFFLLKFSKNYFFFCVARVETG